MMTHVRAKFRVTSIEDFGMSKQVKMVVAYDPTANGENANFTKATPSGELKMTIDNPAAAIQFEVGKHYYADFTEATEASNG
jgi:hypothetical protein